METRNFYNIDSVLCTSYLIYLRYTITDIYFVEHMLKYQYKIR
jgi:hypothetical protein